MTYLVGANEKLKTIDLIEGMEIVVKEDHFDADKDWNITIQNFTRNLITAIDSPTQDCLGFKIGAYDKYTGESVEEYSLEGLEDVDGYVEGVERSPTTPEIRRCEDNGITLVRIDGEYKASHTSAHSIFKTMPCRPEVTFVKGGYPGPFENVFSSETEELRLPVEGFTTKQDLAERVILLNGWQVVSKPDLTFKEMRESGLTLNDAANEITNRTAALHNLDPEALIIATQVFHDAGGEDVGGADAVAQTIEAYVKAIFRV